MDEVLSGVEVPILLCGGVVLVAVVAAEAGGAAGLARDLAAAARAALLVVELAAAAGLAPEHLAVLAEGLGRAVALFLLTEQVALRVVGLWPRGPRDP